jgi:hypothetical protein
LELRVPPSFGVREVARCGEHDIASMLDDAGEKHIYTVLDDPASSSRDWLARIGIRKVLQTYRDIVTIHSRYGRCAFPPYARTMRPWIARGLARFDAGGLSLFSFEQSAVPLADDEVSFNKDGCRLGACVQGAADNTAVHDASGSATAEHSARSMRPPVQIRLSQQLISK